MRYFILLFCILFASAQTLTARDLLQENINYIGENYVPAEPIKQHLLICGIGAGLAFASYYFNPTVSLRDSLVPDLLEWSSSYIFCQGVNGLISCAKKWCINNTLPASKNQKKINDKKYIDNLKPKIDIFAIALTNSIAGAATFFMPSIQIDWPPSEPGDIGWIFFKGISVCSTCWGVYNLGKLFYPSKKAVAAPRNIDYIISTGSFVINRAHAFMFAAFSLNEFDQINGCIRAYSAYFNFEKSQKECLIKLFIERELSNRASRILSYGAVLVYVIPIITDVAKKTYKNLGDENNTLVDEKSIIRKIRDKVNKPESTKTLNIESSVTDYVDNLPSPTTRELQKEALRQIEKRDNKFKQRSQRLKRTRQEPQTSESHLKVPTINRHEIIPDEEIKYIRKLEKLLNEIDDKTNITPLHFDKIINAALKSKILRTDGKKPSGTQVYYVADRPITGVHPKHGGDTRVERNRMNVLWAIYAALKAEHGID